MDVKGIVLSVYFVKLLFRLINDLDGLKREKRKNLLDRGELISGNKLFIRQHWVIWLIIAKSTINAM